MRLLVVLLFAGCSVNEGALPRFENVDLMGASFESEKVPSEARCRDWCAQNEKCAAYTYGGPTVKERFRGRCYLKSAGFKFIKTKGFTSGIKR